MPLLHAQQNQQSFKVLYKSWQRDCGPCCHQEVSSCCAGSCQQLI